MASNMPLVLTITASAVVLLLLGPSPGSAQSTMLTVPRFVSGSANISLTNETFTGRTIAIALTSPGGLFELALIQDGFGTDTRFQYCWTEVHDTATGMDLTWRAPCNPSKVDECSLILTSDGDFRLEVAADGSDSIVAFLSETGGDDVVDVQLTDEGDLLLVKADNTSVWKSSDHIQRQKKCKKAFDPSSGSHLSRYSSFGFILSILLSSIAVSFYF